MTGTDSAGQPWAGRRFHHDTPYAGDDGSAPEALLQTLAEFRAGAAGPAQLAAVFARSRLLVPLLAEAGDFGMSEAGRIVDKTQELSIVTVLGPDGRTVLPAFSSVEAMAGWDATARPIPVEGRRIALAAAEEGTPCVILDPGSEATQFGLRRPALWAIAQGLEQDWVPSYLDPEVLTEFVLIAEQEPSIGGVQLLQGDPQASLQGPELIVQLTLAAGLVREELDRVLAAQGQAWAENTVIAERVDSLGVRVQPGSAS